MSYTPHGKAKLAIERQLAQGKRYGHASVTVRGNVRLEIWAYRAVLRRAGKSKLYCRYVYVIDDVRISARTAASLMAQDLVDPEAVSGVA